MTTLSAFGMRPRARTALPARRQGHHHVVHSIAFVPDSATLVSGGADRSVRVWDVMSGAEQVVFRHQRPVVSVAAHVNLVAAGEKTNEDQDPSAVRLWDVKARRQVSENCQQHGTVEALAFTPDGGLLAVGGYDRQMRLWDVDTGGLYHELSWQATNQIVRFVAFSPDGFLMALGFYSGAIEIWDVRAKALARTLDSRHSYGRLALAFSPGGDRLASGAPRVVPGDIRGVLAFSPTGDCPAPQAIMMGEFPLDLLVGRPFLTAASWVISCGLLASGRRAHRQPFKWRKSP